MLTIIYMFDIIKYSQRQDAQSVKDVAEQLVRDNK